jgi:hypothetical protein
LNKKLTKNNCLTEFANNWQKYLETAQTPEELNNQKGNILATVDELKMGQRSQIQIPPK